MQCAFAYAQVVSGYHIAKTFHIAGSGGWDFIAVDPGSDKLYQSHATLVNILDKVTGDSIGIIPNTIGVHGIAFVDDLAKGYTSNGKINTVTVFDLRTDSILNQITVGQGPDAILYDAFSKKIITCNGRSKNLSIIDPITDKLVDSIAVGGKPEVPVTDNAGKIYVNIEDKSEVVEIDMIKMEVINHWALSPGESPTGLAIDQKTKRLFSGCDNKILMVMDANSFAVNEIIPTKKGARTIAIDETTHRIYLPTADLEVLPANAAPGTRPKIIPNTFQILVVEK